MHLLRQGARLRNEAHVAHVAETEEGAGKAASRRRKAGEVEVVMSKSRVQIVKACHNDPTAGHHGYSTNSIWLCSTCGN